MSFFLMAAKRAGGAAPATSGTLPLTLRADGTGTVRYLGYIPMQPDQMTTGDAANWKVTRNDTSAELAIHTTERGVHLGGSVMGVHLQVEATHAGSDIACTLHLNSTRTQNLASAVSLTYPTMTTGNWETVSYTHGMVACTDATHLCKADLFPNLTPKGHSALSGAPSWVADTYTLFEATEASYYPYWANAGQPSIASSNYDRPAMYMQYYCVTGNLDYLEKSLRTWTWPRQEYLFSAWAVNEPQNFDDSTMLAWLFWNDTDAIEDGYGYFINGTAAGRDLCNNYSYQWTTATDSSVGDNSPRWFGRYLRILTWAVRSNYFTSNINGQTLLYWAQAWRDRIWEDWDGWDVDTVGRFSLDVAGYNNIGRTTTVIIFQTGILADGLTMFDRYVEPLGSPMRTRLNAVLDYARGTIFTPTAPDVTPRITYLDNACYIGGGNLEVSYAGEAVCLDIFLAWMWAVQGGAAATQAALSGSYVVLTPQGGNTGPYINVPANGVSQKVFDEIFHRVFLNIGTLYPVT